jgi:hypothetical protein
MFVEIMLDYPVKRMGKVPHKDVGMRKKLGRWGELLEFVVHAVIGSCMFIAVAVLAVFIHVSVVYLTSLGVSGYVLTLLTTVEYVIVTLDAVVLVRWCIADLRGH